MSSNSSDQSIMESQPHSTVLTSAQGIAPASRKPSVPSSITSTSTSTGKPVSPIFGSNYHTPVSIASLQATYNPPNVNKSLAALDFRKDLFNASPPLQGDSVYGDSWQSICLKVLPLFNGEGVKGYLEDLNDMISAWGKETPNGVLTEEINELLYSGMLTLSSKLQQQQQPNNTASDESLLATARVAELWSFFFGTVLPYLQGVFLPVKILSKARVVGANTDNIIDIRNMALSAFRDFILIPLLPTIEEAYPKLPVANGVSNTELGGRILQMMYILNSLPQTYSSANADALKYTLELISRHRGENTKGLLSRTNSSSILL